MGIKFTMGLLLGAAAGAAIIHYLDTPEGQAMAERIKKDISGIGDKLDDLAADIMEKGKSFMEADMSEPNA